jgi:hypothetical protein
MSKAKCSRPTRRRWRARCDQRSCRTRFGSDQPCPPFEIQRMRNGKGTQRFMSLPLLRWAGLHSFLRGSTTRQVTTDVQAHMRLRGSSRPSYAKGSERILSHSAPPRPVCRRLPTPSSRELTATGIFWLGEAGTTRVDRGAARAITLRMARCTRLKLAASRASPTLPAR